MQGLGLWVWTERLAIEIYIITYQQSHISIISLHVLIIFGIFLNISNICWDLLLDLGSG